MYSGFYQDFVLFSHPALSKQCSKVFEWLMLCSFHPWYFAFFQNLSWCSVPDFNSIIYLLFVFAALRQHNFLIKIKHIEKYNRKIRNYLFLFVFKRMQFHYFHEKMKLDGEDSRIEKTSIEFKQFATSKLTHTHQAAYIRKTLKCPHVM